MGPVVDVISIGALSRNRFWGESTAVRPAHATTTLIRHEDRTILVDPSLPPEILAARLNERTGLEPERIDMVFLTTFRPVHRRGISLFGRADWLMYDVELEGMRSHLQDVADHARGEGSEPDPLVEEELALLERFKAAPDKLARGVDLFPTPGVSPGACGLLVVPAQLTIAICGDAIVGREYFENGRIYEQCADVEAAQESFRELCEIADVIVPGHDNIFHNLVGSMGGAF
jgi:glyoxylase-like metal-dependent hydrolase (beta-lactamase superfamily II)